MTQSYEGGKSVASIDPQAILDAAGGPPPTMYLSRSTAVQADAYAHLAVFMRLHQLPPLSSLQVSGEYEQVRLSAQPWAKDDTAAVAAWAAAAEAQVMVRKLDKTRVEVSADVVIAVGCTLRVWTYQAVAAASLPAAEVVDILRGALITDDPAGDES